MARLLGAWPSKSSSGGRTQATNYASIRSRQLKPEPPGIAAVFGALFMIPIGGPPLLQVRWSALPAPAWWGLAFMVTLGSAVSYLMYAFALKELVASRVAAFAYLQPVIATALGIWLLAEKITLRVVVGGALILLGVYVTERERGDEKPFRFEADRAA